MKAKSTQIQNAIGAFQKGEPVMIFDFEDRERETDIIHPVESMNVKSIKRISRISNNSLNAIITFEFAQRLGLFPLAQLLPNIYPEAGQYLKNRNNGTGPNFTFPIDHISCKSGCSYPDIHLTLSALVELYKNSEKHPSSKNEVETFHENFRIPGHLPLLISAEGLLEKRRGHTELGVALALSSSITPILVTSELLDPKTGETLNGEKSLILAERMDIPFLSGEDFISIWKNKNEEKSSNTR